MFPCCCGTWPQLHPWHPCSGLMSSTFSLAPVFQGGFLVSNNILSLDWLHLCLFTNHNKMTALAQNIHPRFQECLCKYLFVATAGLRSILTSDTSCIWVRPLIPSRAESRSPAHQEGTITSAVKIVYPLIDLELCQPPPPNTYHQNPLWNSFQASKWDSEDDQLG